jgi:iron(III) transport system ATP-binding protein
LIEVVNLVKTYRGSTVPAVDGVTFTVPKGGFYTMLGPSGCGKTTTLRCVAGLERPESGTIRLGERTVVSSSVYVPTYRRDIGMVFQSYAVWPHMTLFQNVAFPLEVASEKPPKAEIERRVHEALDLVGLGGLSDRMATQLSGGQQQRLSVARALVREPDVLLLDEPLSNLDAKLRERMRSELLLIQRRVGITTLFVTHDQIEALSMSDRVAIMNHGKIVQEGTPRDVYQSPANEFVASFIGSTNLFRGRVTARDAAAGTVVIETGFGAVQAAAPDPSIGDDVMIAIRPEDIVLNPVDSASDAASGTNILTGAIEIDLFTGVSVEHHVRVESEVLLSRVGSRSTLRTGDAVRVELPGDAIRVFAMGGPDSAPVPDDEEALEASR